MLVAKDFPHQGGLLTQPPPLVVSVPTTNVVHLVGMPMYHLVDEELQWIQTGYDVIPAFQELIMEQSIQRVHRYQKSSISLGLNLRPAPTSPKLSLCELLGLIPSPLTSTPSCCAAPEDLGFSHLAGGEKLLDPLVFLPCSSLPSFASGIQITT